MEKTFTLMKYLERTEPCAFSNAVQFRKVESLKSCSNIRFDVSF